MLFLLFSNKLVLGKQLVIYFSGFVLQQFWVSKHVVLLLGFVCMSVVSLLGKVEKLVFGGGYIYIKH